MIPTIISVIVIAIATIYFGYIYINTVNKKNRIINKINTEYDNLKWQYYDLKSAYEHQVRINRNIYSIQAEKEKVFGDEENKILNDIIEKNLVETKNNFFDYYDYDRIISEYFEETSISKKGKIIKMDDKI